MPCKKMYKTMDEIQNENNPEEEQDAGSLPAEQNPSEASEGEKTPEEEGSIPYDRFQEVNQEKNDLREELGGLKEEIETLKAQQPKVEEEEPTTWKEFEERAVKKAVSQMEDKTNQSKQENAEDEEAIEKNFDQLKSMGKEITNETKNAVLEQMIKTGGDVFDSYLQVQTDQSKESKADEIKQQGSIPSSQKGSEANANRMSYDQLKKTSLDDIVAQGSA